MRIRTTALYILFYAVVLIVGLWLAVPTKGVPQLDRVSDPLQLDAYGYPCPMKGCGYDFYGQPCMYEDCHLSHLD